MRTERLLDGPQLFFQFTGGTCEYSGTHRGRQPSPTPQSRRSSSIVTPSSGGIHPHSIFPMPVPPSSPTNDDQFACCSSGQSLLTPGGEGRRSRGVMAGSCIQRLLVDDRRQNRTAVEHSQCESVKRSRPPRNERWTLNNHGSRRSNDNLSAVPVDPCSACRPLPRFYAVSRGRKGVDSRHQPKVGQ